MATLTESTKGLPVVFAKPIDWGKLRSDEDPFKTHDEALKSLEEESEAAVARGSVAGCLIRFQVADGYAHYRCVSEKPLKLQHVPYLDGYMVPYATIRGLRKDDIFSMAERDVRFKRAWKKG